jgi:hypothetical protein
MAAPVSKEPFMSGLIKQRFMAILFSAGALLIGANQSHAQCRSGQQGRMQQSPGLTSLGSVPQTSLSTVQTRQQTALLTAMRLQQQQALLTAYQQQQLYAYLTWLQQQQQNAMLNALQQQQLNAILVQVQQQNPGAIGQLRAAGVGGQ